MGVLTHALLQSGDLIQAQLNAYGDQTQVSTTTVPCRFRHITEIDRNTNQEGIDTADAIIWFEPDVNVVEGTIIKVEDAYWRVERLIKARRLASSQVLFLKTLVNKHAMTDLS